MLCSLPNVSGQDLNEGLVVYYPFNGNANDESGNGNHGTVNGATLTTDRNGKERSSYYFNANGESGPPSDFNNHFGGDYIDLGQINPFQNSSTATVSLWIKPEVIPSGNPIANSGSDVILKKEGYFMLTMNKFRNLQADIGASFWNQNSRQWRGSYVDTANNIELKKWHHLTAVLNEGRASFYLQGQLLSSSDNDTFNVTDNAWKAVIGAYYTGEIDDIRIYNRALSAVEVSALYESENSPCEPPTDFRVATPFLASTSLELSWTDNCKDETGYEFQVLFEGQEWLSITTSPPNSTLLPLRGGSPNRRISLRMRTVRLTGNSDWTEPVEVTFPNSFAIEAGRFVGGTVGDPLAGPILRVYNALGEGTASRFTVSGLPPDWEFDSNTGVISAIPAAPGVYRPMISATDGISTASTFVTFRIKPAFAGPEAVMDLPGFLFLKPPAGRIRYNLTPHFRDPDTSRAIRFQTNLGIIDSILYPLACPAHVENLLNYIDRGDYDEVIFHRSAIPATSGVAVVQAGLMKPDGNGSYMRVVTDATVIDEPAFSNLAGTLAMAKTSAPNSGSSQVYFNTTDNTSLDGPQSNGGYTVFGRATASSLAVLEDMHSLPRGNYPVTIDGFEQTLNDWPTTVIPEGNTPAATELIQILRAQRIEELLFYRLQRSEQHSLVAASLDGSVLILDPVPGAIGSSTISLEVYDLDGNMLPANVSYSVLDLAFRPGLSANGHPTVTFRHEKVSPSLSYEVQSSRDGLGWSTFWRTGDGTTAAAVTGRVDLGRVWELTIEDSSISSTTTRTALLRIAVSR